MTPNRQSIRLKNHDYSSSGYYFVTICTNNRECLFGNIVGATRGSPASMKLNDIGKIVTSVWQTLPDHHSVKLDAFQIMPNHIHFIVNMTGKSGNGHAYGRGNPAPTLGQIIAYFKYESTKQINQYSVRAGVIPPDTIEKIFQRNYYEHIIRTEYDLDKIREYIETNPQMWNRDRNNIE